MDLQVYPFPRWLTVLIAKLPVNSTVLVLLYYFCGAPFAVFHCLKWEGGETKRVRIGQVLLSLNLRSRFQGCIFLEAELQDARFSQPSWKKGEVLIFMALSRCMAILKCSEMCSESRWQSWEDDSGVVQCSVPWGVFSIFALLFDLPESGPRAKLLIESGEWATFFHLHFQSLQPITSYRDDAKNQLLEKCLMRGTNEPLFSLFFPFPSHSPAILCSLLILFLLLFLYMAGTCLIFLLSCLCMLLVKNKTEWRKPSPCLFFFLLLFNLICCCSSELIDLWVFKQD